MPQAIRNTFFSMRDLLASFGPYVLIVLVILGITLWRMDPFPPKHLVMATGPANSEYAEFGKKYAAYLKPHGITLTLKQTGGSRENLLLLRDGKVDIGFVQGGSGKISATDDAALASVGSLFPEPIWIFYRADRVPKLQLANGQREPTRLSQLKNFKLNVDTEMSGVPRLMELLFEGNGTDIHAMKTSHLDDEPAAAALISGEVDAIVLVQVSQSKVIRQLLKTPNIKLMSFAQGTAYDSTFPFLTSHTLKRGIVNLGQDIPAQDVELVGPTTSLLVRNTTHPAALLLLSMAADKFHSGEGWFNKGNEYPNDANTEVPITSEAERYMKNGMPYLQRHMPFWAANLVDRLWVVMSVLFIVLIPLSKILPPLYQYRIRRRIFKCYAQLSVIEAKADDVSKHAPLLKELNALAQKVERINVPLAYMNELFSLRTHIQLVEQKLQND
jgi:NMT1-like family